MLSLFAALALTAQAGDLKVDTKGSVMVLVDGEVLQFPEGRNAVKAWALDDGRHLVEVRTLGGRRITELEVEVPYNKIVTVQYKKKRLAVQESKYLPGHSAPPPPPPPSEGVTTTTTVTATEDLPEPDALELPTTIGVGSVEISPVATEVEVWVDSGAIALNPDTGSHQKTELVPGEYTLRVQRGDKILVEGPFEVKPGKNYRCDVTMEDDNVACEHKSPALGLPVIQTASLEGDQLKRVYAIAKMQAEAERDAGPPPPVKVQFVQADALDFANVYVGGVKIFEYRKGGETSQTTELVVGLHPVEIKDFTDSDVWATGKLIVTPGDPIVVQFGEDEGVTVEGRDSAWVTQ